eukprot:13156-Heterococcus_DN1.PRE.2
MPAFTRCHVFTVVCFLAGISLSLSMSTWGMLAAGHVAAHRKQAARLVSSHLPPPGKFRRISAPAHYAEDESYTLQFDVEGELRGVLVLESTSEIEATPEEESIIISHLRKALYKPTQAQLMSFREDLIAANPSLTPAQVFSIPVEDLVHGMM